MRGIRWFSLAILVVSASISLAADTNQMPWQPNLDGPAHRRAVAPPGIDPFLGPLLQALHGLEQEVFSHADVACALESNFVLVRLNVEKCRARPAFTASQAYPLT